jgi:hypothetical protein
MEVHSENYKGFRVAVYQTGDNFSCCIYTGTFGYFVVEHFTATSGMPPTRFSDGINDALAHAKTQIDTEKLRP